MAESWTEICLHCSSLFTSVPSHVLLVTLFATFLGLFVLVSISLSSLFGGKVRVPRLPLTNVLEQFYVFLFTVAPTPRKPLPEEKKFRTISKDGSITESQQLPCWYDTLISKKHTSKSSDSSAIEPPELFMSLVVPAFNEEDRLGGMLEEAVNYLERKYGTLANEQDTRATITIRNRKTNGYANGNGNGNAHSTDTGLDRGWEILVVSDGSTDKTEEMAFTFAREHQLSSHPKAYAGPWTPKTLEGVHIPPGTIRVVSLTHNRGKGGAVTHGMRHVRGQYVVFADADGASKFDHLGKLVTACREIEDCDGRGVAVGSRAHMVGSEAVVKVIPSLIPSLGVLLLQLDRLTCEMVFTALETTQFPHAFVPLDPLAIDSLENCYYQRYPVRLQVVFPRFFAVYCSVYAF